MKIVKCSKTSPWGIHTALRDDRCPRCGWDASPAQPELPAYEDLAALGAIIGGGAGAAVQPGA